MAEMVGFKKPILHGLCTFGFASRALLSKYANNDVTKFKSIEGRFSSPVIPGDTLVTETWQTSPTQILFQTKVKSTGKVAIANGVFELKSVSKL